MKTPLCIVLICLAISLSAQTFRDFSIGYTYLCPVGTMQKNIVRSNGFTMDYMVGSKRLAAGAELSYSIYGHDKSRQVYTFSDGTQADMDIIVNNTISTFSLLGRYYLIEENYFRPFITAKAGYSWFRTDLNIYDPNDWDHCEPVDKDLLLKDGTFTASAGAGMQWDISSTFRKLAPNRFLFTLAAGLVLGGRVNYMNADGPTPHHPPSSDVRARFIDTRTQVIHEHHVGFVYTSFVELIDLRAGFVLRSSW